MTLEQERLCFQFATIVVGIAVVSLLWWIVRKAIADFSKYRWLTMLIVFTGIALGALIGSVSSPESKESVTFSTIATLALALLSGIIFTSLAAGVDATKILPAAVSQAPPPDDANVLPRLVALIQLYGFVAGLAIGGMTLYVFRAYAPSAPLAATSPEVIAQKVDELAKWIRSQPSP